MHVCDPFHKSHPLLCEIADTKCHKPVGHLIFFFFSTNHTKIMVRSEQKSLEGFQRANMLWREQTFSPHVENKWRSHSLGFFFFFGDVPDRCSYSYWSLFLTDYLHNFKASLKPKGHPVPATVRQRMDRRLPAKNGMMKDAALVFISWSRAGGFYYALSLKIKYPSWKLHVA